MKPTNLPEAKDDELLNSAAAAKLLGISVGALHKRVQRGQLKPAARVPAGWKPAMVFRKSDLLKKLKNS